MARTGDNIYMRHDGRFEGRYKKGRKENGTLKYGYVYGRTRKEALSKLKEKQKLYTPSLWKKEKESISWWMYKWLNEWEKDRIAITSYALYERLIRLHIVPALGNMSLSQVKEKELREFVLSLKEKKLSNSSVNHICALLNRALKQAGAEGYLEKIPVIRKLKEERRAAGKVLDHSERKLLDRYLSEKRDPALMLGAYLGMRLGEVCALRWEDLDFENGYLYIRRSVQCISVSAQVRKLLKGNTAGRTAYVVKTPKTPESSRMLPLPEAVLRELQYLEARKCYEGNGYVFGTRSEPARPRTMQKHFETVCKKYIGRKYGFHALRHTFATCFMEKCNNPEMLRGLLGHSSINITLGCYVHSDEEGKREAVEKMMPRIA